MTYIPRATYRLQLRPEFGFCETENILEYLSELGISDLYFSPILTPRRGSQHGYDVVDPRVLNPELGGEEAFRHLVKKANELGLGVILDIVPNHQAFSAENPMLMDVLERGPESQFFDFFDVLWDHPYSNINQKVLTPFLGDFYSQCLERGELSIAYDEAGYSAHYYEWRFPLRIETYSTLLEGLLSYLYRVNPLADDLLVKLKGIVRYIGNISAERELSPGFDQLQFVKKVIWSLVSENEPLANALQAYLKELNGNPEDPASFEALDQILSNQHFRLAYWKVGTDELNYRRFFTINELISVSAERPHVFDYTHEKIGELAQQSLIQGVRIDHIDGLYDPSGYLNRIRKLLPEQYIVAEKILEHHEELPSAWPIQGTSGYDFLGLANSLFCCAETEREMSKIYREFTGRQEQYAQLILDKKRMIISQHMAGDIDNLALLLKEHANRYWYGRDLTLYALRRSMVEILAHFPVYRTYVNAESFEEREIEILRQVFDKAKRSLPQYSNVIELIERHIFADVDSNNKEDQEWNGWRHFLMRLQQFSSPLMAKGVEDTALYLYNRLVSLNEVGASPQIYGLAKEDFNQSISERAATWPHAMNSLSTHDTKRSEDVRARISVLSEIPDVWSGVCRKMRQANARFRKRFNDRVAPTRPHEYLFFQTVLGSLPSTADLNEQYQDRLVAYMIKACREAKDLTSWTEPDTHYEQLLENYIRNALSSSRFIEAIEIIFPKITFFGALNSIAQTVLKLTCPGVPDTYQGSECWDFSLVDPDNRRPVDFEYRKQLYWEIDSASKDKPASLIEQICQDPLHPRTKLYLVSKLLKLRKQYPKLFAIGGFYPLAIEGEKVTNWLFFARRHNNTKLIIGIPRLLARLDHPTSLPLDSSLFSGTMLQVPSELFGNYQSCFSGQQITLESDSIPVVKLLDAFPAVTLIAD